MLQFACQYTLRVHVRQLLDFLHATKLKLLIWPTLHCEPSHASAHTYNSRSEISKSRWNMFVIRASPSNLGVVYAFYTIQVIKCIYYTRCFAVSWQQDIPVHLPDKWHSYNPVPWPVNSSADTTPVPTREFDRPSSTPRVPGLWHNANNTNICKLSFWRNKYTDAQAWKTTFFVIPIVKYFN